MGNAPDPICRLIRELRDYAEDRYTPGELTHVLDAAAAALEGKDAEIERLKEERDDAKADYLQAHNAKMDFFERSIAAEAALKEAREVTPEKVTVAMRAFEQFAPNRLRYPEAEKWHLNDIQGMREALKAALLRSPSTEKIDQ